MAMDVGISQYLPDGHNFHLTLLSGKRQGAATPALRKMDLTLYNTLARLWYTRHGIVHKGERNVYDRRPQPGVTPVERLTIFHADEFLCAVPKGVEFVEANPPYPAKNP
jgi:hypothetical protein